MKNKNEEKELVQFNCIHSNIVSAWEKLVPKIMNISEHFSNMDTEEKEGAYTIFLKYCAGGFFADRVLGF